MTNPHWRASVRCNRLLCGQRGQPLCARIYARPPSWWRSAFLFACDVGFGEYRHCERIWRIWRHSQR